MRHLRLLGAFLVAACSSPGEPNLPGIQLDVSLDRASVQASDSVRVLLTLRNVSPQTIQVLPADAYGICLRAFQVFDASDREVALSQGLCAALAIIAPAPIPLPPDGVIVITDYWQPSSSTINGNVVTPGAYMVRGRAIAGDGTAFSRRRTVVVE